MPLDPAYADAIAGIESGGKYGILGPVTKSGDRAFGKYQVMGANIGPWSEQYYGKRLTPEQYLASPEAQDAVFQGVFGKYVEKYGPEGAAKAWFAGEKGMNNPNARDILGTSVAGYGQKFMGELGQQPQPAHDTGFWYPQQPAAPQPAPQAAQAPQSGMLSPQPTPQPSGILSPQQAPPDFADLASLLQPNFRPLRRGLSFRAQ